MMLHAVPALTVAWTHAGRVTAVAAEQPVPVSVVAVQYVHCTPEASVPPSFASCRRRPAGPLPRGSAAPTPLPPPTPTPPGRPAAAAAAHSDASSTARTGMPTRRGAAWLRGSARLRSAGRNAVSEPVTTQEFRTRLTPSSTHSPAPASQDDVQTVRRARAT